MKNKRIFRRRDIDSFAKHFTIIIPVLFLKILSSYGYSSILIGDHWQIFRNSQRRLDSQAQHAGFYVDLLLHKAGLYRPRTQSINNLRCSSLKYSTGIK